MIVIPIMGDQYDNAQRVHEKNFGLRMDAYSCTQEELLNTVDKLVNDESLEERMRRVSDRIQSSRSNEKAADLIEKIIDE
jgi:UDP:flavonoid glycosyltransferase YjiC (YdhE family)